MSSGELLIVGEDGTTLAGAHVLAGLEAERAEVTDRADRSTLVRRAMCLRAVLDDRQATPLAQVNEGVHCGWSSGEMTQVTTSDIVARSATVSSAVATVLGAARGGV
jgi:hypothetical protein